MSNNRFPLTKMSTKQGKSMSTAQVTFFDFRKMLNFVPGIEMSCKNQATDLFEVFIVSDGYVDFDKYLSNKLTRRCFSSLLSKGSLREVKEGVMTLPQEGNVAITIFFFLNLA